MTLKYTFDVYNIVEKEKNKNEKNTKENEYFWACISSKAHLSPPLEDQ